MNQRYLLYAAVLVVGLLTGYGIAKEAGNLQGDAITVPNPFKETRDTVQINDNYICCCLTGSSQTCWSRSDLMEEAECSSSCQTNYNTDSYKYAEWK